MSNYLIFLTLLTTILFVSITPTVILCNNYNAHHRQFNSAYEQISQDSAMSGFHRHIKSNRIAKLNLNYRDITVFVPDVIDNDDDFQLFYHMSFQVCTLDALNRSINRIESVNESNPPLWITRNVTLWVNNAKLLAEKSKFYVSNGKTQIVHVIDTPLSTKWRAEPMPKSADALDFMARNSEHFKVRKFFQRVKIAKLQHLFRRQDGEGHTFFIPIDGNDSWRMDHIDSYIVRGHIVPNQVLFTRPTARNFVFETLANGDFVYIVVMLENATENGVNSNHVKSYTVLGNSEHRKGELSAEIVDGNIPVANGVIHLISRPLGVFDRQLKPFPYLPVRYKIEADPNLNITSILLNRNNIFRDDGTTWTIFAPNNRAFTGGGNFDAIIKRHVLVSKSGVSYDRTKLLEMADDAPNRTIRLETYAGDELTLKVMLPFRLFYLDGEEWGEVGVVRGDYACSDGVVHVIDSLFGVGVTRGKRGGSEEEEVVGTETSSGVWKWMKRTFT